MNSVISTYLRGSPTASVVSESVKHLTRVLESGPAGRLSPSLLEAFLLGDSGALQFVNRTASYDPQNVLHLLNLLQERGFLSSTNFSVEHWESLCHLLYELMRKRRDPQCWTYAIKFLSWSELLSLISTREKLVDDLCDILIPSYEFDKPLEASCDFLAQPLYSKLLGLCLSNFLSTPSVSALQIVVRLTTFGLLLVKLAPSTYLPVLDQLAKTVHEITRRDSMDKLRSTCTVLPSFEEASKLSVAKTLGILLFVLPRAPCQLLTILKNLLVLFPRLAEKEERFQTILNILTQAMRFPASTMNTPPSALSDGEEKENNQHPVQPAIFALRAFVKLTDALTQCDLQKQTHANMMNQLFDLLRVFPTSLKHAEVRLRAWWHFICRLPGELLHEGFKRFISPFLANLLGRYLSISAPLGDPQLHRYKLSDGSAYEGNFEALELTQHVFTCLFQGANLDLKLLDHVPCLQADSDFLVQNSYPLVVALLHWMRLICGHAFARSSKFPIACLPAQPVDRIWTDCIRLVLESARTVLPSDEEKNGQQLAVIRSPSLRNRPAHSTFVTVLEQMLCCTCHLLTPGCLGALDNRPNDLPAGSPNAQQSLNILESLTEFVLQYPVPSQNKTELLFEILLKTLELGGQWIRPDSKPELFATSDRERILHRWCSLSIRLINLDPRLDMGDADAVPTYSRKGGEFLQLLRQVLSALLPDCVQLAAAKHSSTDYGSQDSTMSVFLGQTPIICYSPDALRVWSELADRLTRFIVIEQLICDGDSVMHPNLSAVQATILAPFWLAGSTPAPTITAGADSESSECDNDKVPSEFLSNKDELALAKRLAHLFVAFHQEACLLTTMAANAWIDQLGHALVTLISALPSQPAQHFNFNLLGRLLKCFAQNAERVHEGAIPNAAFNPFTWKVTKDHPFGQLTGLLMALKLCLLYSPWFACPPLTNSQTNSSPVRNQSAKPSARFLTSPPTIPSVQRSGTFDESSCSSSQLTLEERIAATSYKASCGLLDALETVVILVRNHAQEPHLLTILVETLLPAISRLTTCCVQAEATLQAADMELDEPLLITQRRQQTKTALEDVFVSIWRTLGCSPVVLSESDTVSVVRSLSKRSQNASNQRQPKLDPHLCSGLLQAGLSLCDAGPKSPVLKRPFVLWFVGFWNHLVENCPKQGRSWEVVRHNLTEHEETVRHILCAPQQQLSQSAAGHKVPNSGRKLRGRGRRCSTDRSDKLSGSFEESNTTLADLKQERIPLMQSNQTDDSPKSRRSRRGRLSLNRPSVLAQQQTTPVLKIEPSEMLTRSAPGKLVAARRGRRSMLTVSPQKRSPGILASVLGIEPGVNIMESKSTWSPAAGGGSPSPLPGGRPLVKRRLFMSPSEIPGKFNLAAPGQRKRTSSDSEQHHGCKPKFKLESEVLPQPIDFEESAQFVFIPPAPDNARKRRRTLTSHQKERFEEQRKDYLPSTYTELDVSQQSMGDSQSESQSQFSQVSWDQFRTKTTVDEPSEPVLSQNESPMTDTPSTTVEMGPAISAIQTETQTDSVHPLPTTASSPEQKSAVADSDLSVDSESRNPDTGSSVSTDHMVEMPKQDSLTIEETGASKAPSSEERSLSASPKPTDHSSSLTSSKTTSSPVLPPRKPPSPQTPPVNFPLSGLLHRVSPLMCGPSSSRAQRMLALGLQKAAEQTARQKHTDAMPGTPERRLSPTASIQLLKTPLEAESPSGIMRNIASRKKPHRVSFAEQPVVYTFGSPTREQSQVTPPRPPPIELKPLLPTSTETKVVIDLSSSKLSYHDVSTRANLKPTVTVLDVDLDNSQSTRQHSQTKPLNDESPPRAQHRQRKSNSPQRLIITPRSSLTNSPSRAHRKETKLDSRKFAIVKRRRLFMADSPESVIESPATIMLHTQPEKLPSASVVLSRPLVVDSEPIEIEDTQSSQTPVSTSSSPLVALPEATVSETQDDVECELIESSQGTQDSTHQEPPSQSEQCATEPLVEHTPPHHAVSPTSTAEQDQPKNSTEDPLSTPQHNPNDDTGAPSESTISTTVVAHSSESDAEQFIRQSLSQIADKLSCLNPSQYPALLMEALSTFKPLMR